MNVITGIQTAKGSIDVKNVMQRTMAVHVKNVNRANLFNGFDDSHVMLSIEEGFFFIIIIIIMRRIDQSESSS